MKNKSEDILCIHSKVGCILHHIVRVSETAFWRNITECPSENYNKIKEIHEYYRKSQKNSARSQHTAAISEKSLENHKNFTKMFENNLPTPLNRVN